jgi:ribosomal protein S25
MGELMVPYPNGHGSGHAGNATSRERQAREDASGMTLSRQQAALALVQTSAAEGVTVAEAEQFLGVGHGQASSALSHLHRAGRITRLKDRRRSQEIYVAAEFVNGRKESPYNARPQRKHPKFHSDRTVMEAMKVAGIAPTRYESIRKFLEALP